MEPFDRKEDMRSYAFSAIAALLIASPARTSATLVLGGGPEEAIKLFREADAKCQQAHCHQRGRYALGTSQGKTHVLYYTWDQPHSQSLDHSRNFASVVIPKDAQKIRTITKNDGSVAEVFNSETLVKTLGSDPAVWIGAKPGTFVVFHSIGLRKTIISVGDYR